MTEQTNRAPGIAGMVSELNLLGFLLAQPEAGALSLLAELAGEHPWLKPAVEELSAIPLDRWQGEHTRLFINGFPKTPCPPFESAYRHGAMAHGTGDLLALYRAVGFEPDGVPADFLGVELECAARIADMPGHEEASETLWREHLGRWLPGFARDLEEHSRLVLYRLLAKRLAGLAAGAGVNPS